MGSGKSRTAHGFTIVELLVVIVVIGILAAITIVAYTGISDKAVVSSVQSDLSNAKKQLSLYYVDNGAYPASLSSNRPVGPADTRYCLKPSGSNTFVYTATPTGSTSPQAFRLTSTNNSTSYAISNSTQPSIITTTASCPTGFIPVPGSGTYGTNDFCTMKYEAKDAGSSVPVSQAAGSPWVNISQTTAIANSPNVANCTGCHLISEAEWLTIAQNVLSVASNWNGGVVGTSYIYSGHNDNAPANALAVTNTNDGYSDTGNSAPSNQRRTLTLSNGEVIWDLAGNVYEWTSGTSTTGQPGGAPGAGYNSRDYTAETTHGTLSPDPYPATTGISGASSWNSGNGIGVIWSSADETGLLGFRRGCSWDEGGFGGVLALKLYNAPSFASIYIGFRVSR